MTTFPRELVSRAGVQTVQPAELELAVKPFSFNPAASAVSLVAKGPILQKDANGAYTLPNPKFSFPWPLEFGKQDNDKYMYAVVFNLANGHFVRYLLLPEEDEVLTTLYPIYDGTTIPAGASLELWSLKDGAQAMAASQYLRTNTAVYPDPSPVERMDMSGAFWKTDNQQLQVTLAEVDPLNPDLSCNPFCFTLY